MIDIGIFMSIVLFSLLWAMHGELVYLYDKDK